MAGELILIVEDNDKNLKLVRDVLRFKGFRTIEAGKGAEAIALARAERPHLVLMDIQLPDMDGLTALRELRAGPETAAIGVIALTAFAMKEDQAKFIAAGFDGYIAKPIDIKVFPDQVREFCDQKRREGGDGAQP